jgi:dTMP kinase
VGDGEIAEPLLVRRNDEPGGVGRAAAAERVFVGGGIFVPEFPLFEVVNRDFPALIAIVDSFLEATFLFILADVQEEFENSDVILAEHLFEVVDLCVTLGPLRLRDEIVDSNDEDVFILGAVENPDVADRRDCFVNSPKKIVRGLFGGGLLERSDVATLRIDAGHYVADGAVFPRRIEALQDDEEGALFLGIEAILQFIELLEGFFEGGLGLVAFFPTEGVVGVPLREVEVLLPRGDHQFLGEIHGHRRVSLPRELQADYEPREYRVRGATDTLLGAADSESAACRRCNTFLTWDSWFRSMIGFPSGAFLMATVLPETPTTTHSSPSRGSAPKRQYPGALVVVEGIDGSGKSTQLYLLKRWLEIGGYRIHFTEWNSSPLVKSATRRGKQRRLLTPTTFSLLHAADFADRCERQILPLLHGGYLVLADRYIYTAFARDAARGCSPHWLRNLYSFAPIPDITFYFRAPLDVAVNRIVAGRPKLKYYEAGMDLGISLDRAESFRIFQERILTNYDAMVDTDNFVLMDGTVQVNKLQKLMRQVVGEKVALDQFAPKK